MPPKRFTETVSIQPQNLSTGFVQGSNSLLNRLQAFKQSSNRFDQAVEFKRKQEDSRQAQALQASEKANEKKLREQESENIKYKKSLETAYLAGLGNDTKEAISAIEAENPDNIVQFR